MKHTFVLLALLICVTSVYAQYNKEKLTAILTNGSSKAWTVKGVTTERPEKSLTFNTNMTVAVVKGAPAAEQQKWSLTSKDNIRWFLSIGNESYELIVSYAKDGSQYLKLTHQAGVNNVSTHFEMNLFPAK